MTESIRRVVTGHDAHGKSIVLSDAPPPQYHSMLIAFFHIDAQFSDELLSKLPQPLQLLR